MTKKFHYFTLEEVYAYAEKMGYDRNDVEIEKSFGYDYDKEEDVFEGYDVSFGHEGTKIWSWFFEDLENPAIDYECSTWED